MKKVKEVSSNLRIGSSCMYMNISGIYEKIGALYLAFGYTHLDFIYNKERFTKFVNPKPAIDYISKDNELVIATPIDSKYMEDIYYYSDIFASKISEPIIEEFEVRKAINWNFIKENYLDKEIPVLIFFDHYYCYEDYKKKTNKILKFHTTNHQCVLHEIDFENNTATIVDKFYSFKGKVNLDNFIKSVTSKYMSKRSYQIVRVNDIENVLEEEMFRKYCRKNFEATMEQIVTIDGAEYYKSIDALKMFVNDFKSNIEELYEQKGKFAPQFLSKLITPIILQRESFYNLLKYYNETENNEVFEDILELTNESKKLWSRIDVLNDKYYLRKIKLTDVMDKYESLMKLILENDIKIYEALKAYLR